MSFETLKVFCNNEGLFYSKLEQKTNNGKITTLEVRKVKTPHRQTLFTKSVWTPSFIPGKNQKTIDLLSNEFFETFGLSRIDYRYWGVSLRSEVCQGEEEVEEEESLESGTHLKDIETQIDRILDEEDQGSEPPRPPALESMIKAMGTSGQPPDELFRKLASADGLSLLGGVLQDRQSGEFFSNIFGALFSAMPPPGPGDQAFPTDTVFNGEKLLSKLQDQVRAFERPQPEEDPGSVEGPPSVHTPDTPEPFPTDA